MSLHQIQILHQVLKAFLPEKVFTFTIKMNKTDKKNTKSNKFTSNPDQQTHKPILQISFKHINLYGDADSALFTASKKVWMKTFVLKLHQKI